MKYIDKLSGMLDIFAKWMAIIVTGVMWIVMCYAVAKRYIFSDSPVWGDELCRYCLVWLTFYGGTVALRRRSLASMNLLVNRMPPIPRKWFKIFVSICCIVLLACFTKWSLDLTMARSVQMQHTTAMGLPLPLVYSCMPIGLGIMTLQQFVLTIHDIKGDSADSEAEVNP